jgi:Large eukaryotic DNA virus major capsid protein/Major capsid protein N-terminus
MGGGLMQLVAYGAQDIYLTGNPSITFWKTVYRRYTPFALESIEQTFNGTVDFGKKVSTTIARNGDLVYTMFLQVTLQKGAGASYFPAEQLLNTIELQIGGQTIDKYYSDWSRLYSELFKNDTEKRAYRKMTDFDNPAAGMDTGVQKRFYVPLTFFFNKSAGLALPLISLQYHEVVLYLTFETAANMALNGIDTTVSPTATLFADYVFLDTDERRRFAQSSHEYLITQLQHTGAETVAPGTNQTTQNIRLNYNHPTKFLAWAFRGPQYGQFTVSAPGETSDKYAPLYQAKLQLNGQDRFAVRYGSYFNTVQPYCHLKTAPAAGVYMYNFGLKPDEVQPSGSCNFSRIDNSTLIITTKAGSAATTAQITTDSVTLSNAAGNLTSLLIYAENYNVLRIMSGMGGLAYSN